ncbi:MAG: UDP-N-acetylmuramate--L-alanine ligase [Bacteroidales bacterium]|nr:UDP-N-acetylmuramate--L-alanine ligase [Bacteroidales bacterium]
MNHPTHIYFIGIGGIGMSALARYYQYSGMFVAGYDRTPSALTAELEQEGIPIHYEDDPSNIPLSILERPDQTLVIYTPAIPQDHKELNYLKISGFQLIKRSRALGAIADTKRCLAVAGTHGKTTTSTLLAHIFAHSGAGCTAFLGGISKNYHTNLLLSHAPYLVAEADEFDRSFLQLHPDMAIVTSIDADHLDIFGDYPTLQKAFTDFISQIKPHGALVIKEGVNPPISSATPHQYYRYALDQKTNFWASNLVMEGDGTYRFSLHLLGEVIHDCRLGIPGRINVENGVAASALAFLNGIEPAQIKAALASFLGVARRFDIQVNKPNAVYIDDYAHHPAEISAALNSIRNIYPDRKITAIFQPHLYTRTRDFVDDFAESLSLPDELILLPIYPAREAPIEGVSSEMLLQKVKLNNKYLVEKDSLIDFLHTHPTDVLVTLGAGDIDRWVLQIKSFLEGNR